MYDRELFVLEATDVEEVPAVLCLPSPYFACLLALDARSVSDASLTALARRLVRSGCVYICCWGPDCERVHDLFDLADVEFRPNGPGAMSTWHSREPLSEALWFLLYLTAPDDAFFDGCRAAVGVTVGSPTWAGEVRAALSFPVDFSAMVLAAEA